MKLYILIVMFFLLGAFFIVSEKHLALKNADARVELARLYASWLGNIFHNAVTITGNVINLDWLPKNVSG